jgi:hypothetical protein
MVLLLGCRTCHDQRMGHFRWKFVMKIELVGVVDTVDLYLEGAWFKSQLRH